jgi:hypothetical protein
MKSNGAVVQQEGATLKEVDRKIAMRDEEQRHLLSRFK